MNEFGILVVYMRYVKHKSTGSSTISLTDKRTILTAITPSHMRHQSVAIPILAPL